MSYIRSSIVLVVFLMSMVSLTNTPALGGDKSMQRAWSAFLKGDYDRAIGICRSISSSQRLGDEGYYIMGVSFLKLNNFEEARKNFKFILNNYPRSKRRDGHGPAGY